MAPIPGKFHLPAPVRRLVGGATAALRVLRRGVLVAFLVLLLLAAGFREFNPSTIELTVAPHQYSVVEWELGHLPQKWINMLVGALPGGARLPRDRQLDLVQEYFRLGLELERLQRELVFPEASNGARASPRADTRALREQIGMLEDRRRRLQPAVESAVENEVSAVLAQAGLDSALGIFPPVDVVFSSSPHVLVISPRDRIARHRDILLKPGLTPAEKEGIEERIFREENLSAYVGDTGGVAVYPSVVMNNAGLHHAVVITTHEWLHHWLFFRPLGRAFWSQPEMTTLNETVATVAGEELGDRVFTAMTGEVVERAPHPAPPAPGPEAFDFRAELRETRIRAGELLAQGRIEEAEAYMEERRQLFVANGYLLRKLNQAYFAFHGTYATSPASVSPIGEQVRELRAHSDSVGDFLQTVSQFSTYQEFLDHLERLKDTDQ